MPAGSGNVLPQLFQMLQERLHVHVLICEKCKQGTAVCGEVLCGFFCQLLRCFAVQGKPENFRTCPAESGDVQQALVRIDAAVMNDGGCTGAEDCGIGKNFFHVLCDRDGTGGTVTTGMYQNQP